MWLDVVDVRDPDGYDCTGKRPLEECDAPRPQKQRRMSPDTPIFEQINYHSRAQASTSQSDTTHPLDDE